MLESKRNGTAMHCVLDSLPINQSLIQIHTKNYRKTIGVWPQIKTNNTISQLIHATSFVSMLFLCQFLPPVDKSSVTTKTSFCLCLQGYQSCKTILI